MGSEGGDSRSDSSGSHSQGPKSGSLARQGSINGLTFDEVHHQLGDPGKPPQQHEQLQNMLPVYMPGHPVQPPIPMASYPLAGAAFPAILMCTLPDRQTTGRKRVASGDAMEKTIERRQKRMMKNRESAARSRARKQAYTLELENKVSRLEEEKEKLENHRDMEKTLPTVKPPECEAKPRRSLSAHF